MNSSNNKNYKNLNEIEKKDELKEKLKELLPSCFEDNIFNIEKFKQLLGEENNLDQNEKYGLNWVGKSKSFYESTKPTNMTLIPLRNKSVNFDESDNIIIEGDNLEVLKLLEKSYFNKIDVIYIDPPYNTGNDFVYNDDYSQSKFEFDKENNLINEEGDRLQTKNQKSDGRIHTKWLSMIHPRLILAKKLLKDDGVIFISIDDNEQARLKLLCDEIFGEKNFISNLIWRKKNTGGGSDKPSIEIETEYILTYAKNRSLIKINKDEIKIEDYTLEDQYLNERGRYKLTDLDHVCSSSSFQYTESLDYEILAPDGTYFKNYRNIIKPKSYCYTAGKELFDFYNKNGFIEFKKTKEGFWKAYRKSYSFVTIDRKEKRIINREGGNSYNNIIFNNYITTSSGKKELIKIINNKDFSFPKPSALLKHIFKIASKKNSLILDFFAGSGTTAQAVMELNKEDGGNRKYILVQFPEKSENLKDTEFETIADITRERVKRAIDMFQYKEKGYKAFKLVRSNLKSFDASTSDSVDVIQSKLLNFENKIQENTSIENLIYEIILRVGELPLNIKIKSEILYNNKVYYDELKYCLFLLEPSINSNYYNIENIIKVIKNFYNNNNLKIYLNDKYFENDQDKINFAESIKNIKDGSWEIELVVI